MKLFKNTAVRHLATILVNFIITTVLISHNVAPEQAKAIGTAAGQVIGGA